MKVLHCCLAAFYIDDHGYQENIMPKMHMLQGHEVEIVASTETYNKRNEIIYIAPSRYRTKEGIPIERIPYSGILPSRIMKKLRIYEGLKRVLERFKPDILFLHDCQFMSIVEIVEYARTNQQVVIYVDSHTDEINSARTPFSKTVLHGVIYRWCAKKIEPYTRKFYGVLPGRVDFYRDIYGIPGDKIELLVMGVDDSNIDFGSREATRKRIRRENEIEDGDFVVITGGRIEPRKKIPELMRAVSLIGKGDLKLVLMGNINQGIEAEFNEAYDKDRMRYVGWIDPGKMHEYFFAADLAVFPGTHSVLWEQAVGLGLPCIFRRWKGIQHVDLGGNCLFLENGGVDEIVKTLKEVYEDEGLHGRMRKIAREDGMRTFSYSEISRKAIAG